MDKFCDACPVVELETKIVKLVPWIGSESFNGNDKREDLVIDVVIKDIPCKSLIDTRATISILCKQFEHKPMTRAGLTAQSVTGDNLFIKGV